ncbi:MAG: phage tail sheath C-terminal domain-containing protein [Acidobacteriota bacterium]
MAEYFSPGVYIEEHESVRPVEGVRTNRAAFIGPTSLGPILEPVTVSDWNQFETIFGGLVSSPMQYLGYAVDAFFRNGGRKAYIIRVTDSNCQDCLEIDKREANVKDFPDGFIRDKQRAVKGQEQDYLKALSLMEHVEGVGLILVPGEVSQVVQQALLDHCEKMRFRFAILDGGPDLCVAGPGSIQEKRKQLRTERGYGALFYPWLRFTDPNTGKMVFLPPSGSIAGVFARSDRERGVHQIPNGEWILGANGLERVLSNGEQEFLNAQDINTIRSVIGKGICVWGGHTLASNQEWKYINVRRLTMYIEESIERATQWVVFEPNNERTWGRVRLLLTEFLTGIWRDGAIIGSRAREAFYVHCDDRCMTEEDVRKGQLIIDIGIAPLRPSEFIKFKVIHTIGGSEIIEF